ncbi:MAG: YlbF family regulator [Eubacteriales bacterium]|nr:YlbF family regulator [Eubacteriales bacterium]
MTIKEHAVSLGELIKQDAVTQSYFDATEAYKADPELKKLVFEYNVQQTALGEEYKKPEQDKDVIAAIEKRAKELYTMITEHPVYVAYTAAQDKMNELIEMVNREITVAIFGKTADEDSCTHDCSTCHGGCGHEH